MRILATLEARSRIVDAGDHRAARERPGHQRFETKGFVLSLEPGLRPPRELHVNVVGRIRRRVAAFWNGCAFAG